MDIQHIGTNKFLVGLSRSDMEQFDITYDEMDYSNAETRRVIWSILDTVRKRTGKDVDPSGDLLIEAAPDNSGGCMLMFTVPNSRKTGTIIARSSGTQIYEFEDSDSFLDLIAEISPIDNGARFFTDGTKYRAELKSDKASAHQRILREYGRFVGRDSFTAALTHEHWHEIKLTS